MADVDLAPKAPESDMVVPDVAPGEASVQSRTGLGEHCVSDRPTRKPLGFLSCSHANNIPAIGATPSGEITKIADVDVSNGLTPSDFRFH